MYFVFYGHLTPDNWSDPEPPQWKLELLDSSEQVLALRAEWETDYPHTECRECVFRIIRGEERYLKPIEIVKSWELKE